MIDFSPYLLYNWSVEVMFMKISLESLKDKTSLTFTYDFQDYIKNVEDILEIEPAKIHLKLQHEEAQLSVVLTVDVKMTLACAKTFLPVPYHLQFTEDVIFGSNNDVDYALSDDLDLADIIFGYIMSEKPYVVYHPDAKELLFEKEKSPHPAFAELTEYLKK